MGAVPSVPVEDIKRVAEDAFKTFTPLYLKHFANEMLKETKRRVQDKANTDPLPQLLEAEPPTEIIHSGWATKRGAIQKNWKRRFFVARNAADDFVIDYFASEEDSTNEKKRKGRIVLNHYDVNTIDEEEGKQVKAPNQQLTLKVEPYWSSDRRRCWFVCFDSEEDRQQWADVFAYAAAHAPPPLNKDPVRRVAFTKAYRDLRWELGVWGSYSYNATEQEMLGLLISTKCERELMQEVYATIPSGMASAVIRRQLRQALDTTVGAAVAGGWKAVETAIAGVQPKIQKVLDDSIGQVMEVQVTLETGISDSIVEAVKAPLADVVGPALEPVMSFLFKPLLEAHEECVKGFAARMAKVIQEHPTAADQGAAMRRVASDTRYSWSGWLAPAIEKIRALRQYRRHGNTAASNAGDALIVIMELFGDNMSFWQVMRLFEESVRENARNAVWTYMYLVNGGNPTEADKAEAGAAPKAVMLPGDALADTLARMVVDSKMRARDAICQVLYEVVHPTFRKQVGSRIKSAMEPLASQVPQALEVVINLNDMVDEAIHNLVWGVLMEGIIPSATPRLDAGLNPLAQPQLLQLAAERYEAGYPAARAPLSAMEQLDNFQAAAAKGEVPASAAAAAGGGVAAPAAVMAAPAPAAPAAPAAEAAMTQVAAPAPVEQQAAPDAAAADAAMEAVAAPAAEPEAAVAAPDAAAADAAAEEVAAEPAEAEKEAGEPIEKAAVEEGKAEDAAAAAADEETKDE